jgi:hypothetical protein
VEEEKEQTAEEQTAEDQTAEEQTAEEQTAEKQRFQFLSFNLPINLLNILIEAISKNRSINFSLSKATFVLPATDTANPTDTADTADTTDAADTTDIADTTTIKLPLNKNESRLFLKKANVKRYCFSKEKLSMFEIMDNKLILKSCTDKPKQNKVSNRALIDHDHFTGKFRGYSCYRCNTAEGKETKFIPIYFHNLSGYDVHPLVLALSKHITPERPMIPLAKSKECYIGFQFGCLRFIDSLRFVQKSLDDVAESMTDPDFIEQFKSLEKYATSLNDEDLINLETLLPKDNISI